MQDFNCQLMLTTLIQQFTWDINITKPNGQHFGPGGTGFDVPPPGAIAGLCVSN